MSTLMNDQEWPAFAVQPNKTYFLRIINMSGYAQFYFNIEDHNMTIIQADGVYSQPQPVQDLYVATGQRYGVLFTDEANRQPELCNSGSYRPEWFSQSCNTTNQPKCDRTVDLRPYVILILFRALKHVFAYTIKRCCHSPQHLLSKSSRRSMTSA